MQKRPLIPYSLFLIAMSFAIYMPLHVLIVQSASLLTGGLEVWKAAKDVLLVALVPLLLWVAYKNNIFRGVYKWHFLVGSAYVMLHLLFVLFDGNDDTGSAIVGSVYNSRLLGFMLLGLAVGSLIDGEKYLKWLLTAAVLVATAVALFGVLQYFLPPDLLTHVGYSVERGVKPLFFIDDKPDLPRVMSTLKDPNSLGAYLIVPILLTGYALFKKQVNEKLFARPFRRGTLALMLGLQLCALLLTFSRGALIGLGLSTVTILYIVTGQRLWVFVKKHLFHFVAILILLSSFSYLFWNSYTFQNIVFHADQSTVLADPNELRVSLTQQAVDDILEQPLGHGPGTAGLVSIRNPQGGLLTENYYLQIAYEVGWLGLALFVAIISIIIYQLSFMARKTPLAAVLFSSLIGYLFYSLLIHLWSNEAVALQWWLLTGIAFGTTIPRIKRQLSN
jgi:hypothetical protein